MTGVKAEGVVNALTVDLEDWYQGLEIDPEDWGRYEDRLAIGTQFPVQLLESTLLLLRQLTSKCPPCQLSNVDQRSRLNTS